MTLNKSQLLIIGVIASAFLGIPDITRVFTDGVINIVMRDPSPTIVILVLVIKLLLIISSITWLIQLIKYIDFTYRTKSNVVFQNYLIKLVLTAIFTFLAIVLIKNKIL